MAEYAVGLARSATRELEALAPRPATRVLTSIAALASDPRPRQSRKLTGSEGSYRLRVGDYRILYQVDDEEKVVKVYAVGHRRDVYR